MTLNEIKEIVRTLERNDLVELKEFVTRISSSTHQFFVGRKVEFTHSKTNAVIRGVITKINRKTIKVDTRQNKYGADIPYTMTWSVPPYMLKVIKS